MENLLSITGAFGVGQTRLGELQVRVAVNLVFDRLEFGFGFKPDGQVAVAGAALGAPKFFGAEGDLFMGDGVLFGHFF
jgi:hypothetical protein